MVYFQNKHDSKTYNKQILTMLNTNSAYQKITRSIILLNTQTFQKSLTLKLFQPVEKILRKHLHAQTHTHIFRNIYI